MVLDTEELEMIARAVGKARKAYEDEVSQDAIDPAYFPMDIIVHVLTTNDFQKVGEITYRDLDYKDVS